LISWPDSKNVKAAGVIQLPFLVLIVFVDVLLIMLNAALFPNTPRSLFYPQSEIDLNSNAPAQKVDQDERVFWDN